MPGKITGDVWAIPSKSHLHRLLIFAALSEKETFLSCAETEAEDIQATIDCLTALGATVEKQDGGFAVTPIFSRSAVCYAPLSASECPIILPCMESGSTLRFMLPVANALGICGAFEMKGRLPERPLAPLDSQLERNGINLWRDKPDVLRCEGRLQIPGSYHIAGNISSQYISGLLMALPVLNGFSTLSVSLPLESADYVSMTLEAAETFGQKPDIEKRDNGFHYNIEGTGSYISPGQIAVEGDWSNGAFWLCAGAMPGGNIQLRGLKKNSSQGDREICNILTRMGARVKWEGDELHITEDGRNGTEIDARATPDLVPVLAAVAAAGTDTTVIRNAGRLRLKESDRLFSTARILTALGADITEAEDSLVINGRPHLSGGTVDSFGDHRIAMTAAIASAACTEPVIITGAQAVNKSYPAFWKDLAALGKDVRVEE